MEVYSAPITFVFMVKQHALCTRMMLKHVDDEKEIYIYLEPLFT